MSGELDEVSSGYSLHGQTPEDGIHLSLSRPGDTCGRVTRLSPTAVWALPSPGAPRPPREKTLQVMLEGQGTLIGPLKGETLWSDPEEHDAPLGIQLVDVSREQGQQILSLLDAAARQGNAQPAASPLPLEEALVDPARIRAILKSVSVMKHKGVLRRLGQTVRMTLESIDHESSLLYWRCEEPGVELDEAPCELEVVGYNSAYRLHVPSLGARGSQLVTPMPEQLWRVRHRWHRRVPAPAGLRARFHHPLWGELGLLEREAVDVSFSGLGLRNLPEDLVFPGLILQPLVVEMEGGEPIHLRGEVRYITDKREGGRVCGLQVSPCTPRDEARWVHLVSQALCPTTRSGAEWACPGYVDSRFMLPTSPVRLQAQNPLG